MLHRREIETGSDTCLLGYSGREHVSSAVFDATYADQGGVSEVQTLTVDATGGTYTTIYKDQTTSAIAEAATAATVQAALRALSRIGSDGVAVTGSAGGPYTITFTGRHANKDVELLTTDDALLTGGAATAVVVQTTVGSALNAGLYVLECGLVLKRVADKVQPYDGSGDICGIFDGRREFFDNTNLSDIAIPVYDKFCVFNKKKVQGYDDYETALLAWGVTNDCHFRAQGASTY